MRSPGCSEVNNPPAIANGGSISGSGRSPGRINGNPFQYSFLGNPMDLGAWQATFHGVKKEPDVMTKEQQTTKGKLSMFSFNKCD